MNNIVYIKTYLYINLKIFEYLYIINTKISGTLLKLIRFLITNNFVMIFFDFVILN